jgi:hypothetical protein
MRLMLATILVLAVAAPATAADLTVVPRKKVVHVYRHKVVLRAVRDYDGTPITMTHRFDGTIDTHLAMRASPTRYFNGERVTPWSP